VLCPGNLLNECNVASGAKAPLFSAYFVRAEALTHNPELLLFLGRDTSKLLKNSKAVIPNEARDLLSAKCPKNSRFLVAALPGMTHGCFFSNLLGHLAGEILCLIDVARSDVLSDLRIRAQRTSAHDLAIRNL
jgi:hypothetical protein